MSNHLQQKVGVLGGGQLGKMLGQAASDWHLPLYFLDKEANFPAAIASPNFVIGDFKNYDDVLSFGREMDVLTIEIEHVNMDALFQLEKEGKVIHPNPRALQIIGDKGLQKQFYQQEGIPTAAFQIFDDHEQLLAAINAGRVQLPLVQKSRRFGYDGKGVAVLKELIDLPAKFLSVPSLIEEMVPIEKELAVIAARNPSGEVSTFPAVEMVFHPEANLVEYLLCPASIAPEVAKEAQELAQFLIKKLDICGLLAVELFLTKSGKLLVNEVAPRPHNSGHHTINSCQTSQFQQHLRGILDLPLGSTTQLSPSVMVNLLGAAGHTGPTFLEGLSSVLSIEGVHLHFYGKQITKPYRKMGHATIVDQSVEQAIDKAKKVKAQLRIVSQST